MACYHCKSTNLIEDGGYLTCRSCGTVNQDGVLAVDVSWMECSADYRKTFCEEEHETNCVNNKFLIQLKDILEGLNLADYIVKMVQEVFTMYRQKHLRRGVHMKGMMAASVYLVCKAEKQLLPIPTICNLFDISTTIINQCCVDMEEALYYLPIFKRVGKTDDILTRMVYEVHEIEDHWKVIKTCRKLIDKLSKHSLFRIQKPTKINVTIIFIACGVLKLGIQKNVFQKRFNISALTMINHEKLIQDLLSGSRPGVSSPTSSRPR
jgi:transcription initiation factor TFIIIB Brf1 subunit/transcription initiation factor TFIIB